MNQHTWAWKPLILQLAFALVWIPVSNAAEPQEAGSQTSQVNPAAAQPAAKAPQVTYEDGQLTIIAENSPLSDVMKALRAALGADIDLPANVADQRIWVHLGPGPARFVLRDLLDGTEFNYVIQAAENDDDGIRSVLLTLRGKSAGEDSAGSAERAANRRVPPRSGAEAVSVPDSENPSSEPVPSVDPSQATPRANESSATASLQNTSADSNNSAPAAGSRTDQMIQQMQSMYEQRKQLQMQQNRKPTGQNQ